MTDDQEILIELAKVASELARISLNAAIASDSKVYLPNIRETVDKLNEKSAEFRILVRKS